MKVSGLADSPLFTKASFISVIEYNKPISKTKHQNSHQGTMVSCYHGISIEAILKVMGEYGEEATTYRLTLGEKKSLAKILYTYRLKNIGISENEIIRLAVNSMILNFKLNRKESTLVRFVNAMKYEELL